MGRIGTFYASLPAWVQGILVAVEGGLIGFLLQWASDPDPVCFSRICLRHFVGAAGGAVVVSIRNWLKESPRGRDAWTPEQRAAINAAKNSSNNKSVPPPQEKKP